MTGPFTEKIRKFCGTRAFEVLVFVLLFAVLLNGLSDIFTYKQKVTVPRLYNLYDGYDRDMVDVLIIGSSHAGQVSVHDLWTGSGIAAYSLTNNAQSADTTYYMIREALKYQHPSLIMVETVMLPDNDMHDPDTEYETDLHADAYFRMSPLYLQMVADQIRRYGVDMTEGLSLLLKWPGMHMRYGELAEDDFRNTHPYLATELGWSESVAEDPGTAQMTDTREPVSAIGEYYLNRIISLCRKEGIELLLFHAPYPTSEFATGQQNTIADIAAAGEVPFIEFNRLRDETGIDFTTDLCADLNHLNRDGCRKLTAYLAAYMASHYALEDHRGDARYVNWEKDVRACDNDGLKQDLKEAESAAGWFELMAERSGDYMLFLSLDGNYKVNDQIPLASWLSSFGISQDAYDAGGAFVLDHGTVTWSSGSPDAYLHRVENMPSDVTLVRRFDAQIYADQVDHSGRNDSIYIGETDLSKALNGLNITVYDPFLDDVVDSIGIDVYLGDGILREEAVY